MEKISTKEVFALSMSLFGCLFPTVASSKIINIGNNATIICSIIGFILATVPLLLILYIFQKQNDENIFRYNIKNFKVLGYIINFLFFVFMTYMSFVICWCILKFTIDVLLIRTSHYVVAFVLFSVIGFTAIKGIETISRSSLILFFVFILVIGFNIAFLIPEVEIENIFPLIDVSNKDFIKTILYITPCTIFPFISILCLSKNQFVDKEKVNKKVILSYSLTSFILILFFILVITIYGIDVASLFTYPEYYVFKKINAFNFIQRIENLSAIIIYIANFGTLSFLAYLSKTYFKDTFNLKKERDINIITYFISLLIPFLSIYVFKTLNLSFLFDNYPLIASPIILIIIIEAILVTIKKPSS